MYVIVQVYHRQSIVTNTQTPRVKNSNTVITPIKIQKMHTVRAADQVANFNLVYATGQMSDPYESDVMREQRSYRVRR